MAPTLEQRLSATLSTEGALMRRDLNQPTDAQKVTLGVIAVYVVVIAILWNVPYIRMVLWPFKVSTYANIIYSCHPANLSGVDARHRLP